MAAAGRHLDVISVQPSGGCFDPTLPSEVGGCVQTLVNLSRLAGRPVFVVRGVQSVWCVLPTIEPTFSCAKTHGSCGAARHAMHHIGCQCYHTRLLCY